jgi:hypothetical protein
VIAAFQVLVAAVLGAVVIVVAVVEDTKANAVHAGVVHGAIVAVVAGPAVFHRDPHTFLVRAGVRRAGVVVVALHVCKALFFVDLAVTVVVFLVVGNFSLRIGFADPLEGDGNVDCGTALDPDGLATA